MLKSINSRVIHSFLHFLSLCVMAFAFPIHTRDVSSGDDTEKITAQTAIAGVLLIGLGAYYCFFGRKYYRITMFIAGLYSGALIAWIVLVNVEPSGGYAGASDTIILIVSILSGVLVGIGLLYFSIEGSSVAVWFIGALGGCTVALFMLAWGSGGMVHSKTVQLVFIIICVVIGLGVFVYFDLRLVAYGTAFIGAYSLVIGADMFAMTGYRDATRLFLDRNHDGIVYNTSAKVYGMLAAHQILFMLGAGIQPRVHRGEFGPAAAEGSVEDGVKRTWRNWYKR